MGNVNMEAKQIHDRTEAGKRQSVAEHLAALDAVAKKIDDMPTYTSVDRAFLDEWETNLPILANDVSNLGTTKANQITIAPFFNAETAYDPGDIVYYNGLSYRCVNAHEGEWDADDFAATTIDNELSSLNSKLNVSQTGQSLSDLASYLSTLTTSQKCRSVLRVDYGTSNKVMPIIMYNPAEYQVTYGAGSSNYIYDMYQYYNGAFKMHRKKNDMTIETTDLSEDVTAWTLYISA